MAHNNLTAELDRVDERIADVKVTMAEEGRTPALREKLARLEDERDSIAA